VVRERCAAGDVQLTLVPGGELVPASELPDGIHPDDRGHARIAQAVGAVLVDQLRAASR
jgi:lysophospholipase L1-like esterase